MLISAQHQLYVHWRRTVCVFIALHSFITCVALQNHPAIKETQQYRLKTPLCYSLPPCPLPCHIPPYPASGNHYSVSTCLQLVVSQLSHKWNYVFCIFLRLAFFTQHKFTEVHLICVSINNSSFPFIVIEHYSMVWRRHHSLTIHPLEDTWFGVPG